MEFMWRMKMHDASISTSSYCRCSVIVFIIEFPQEKIIRPRKVGSFGYIVSFKILIPGMATTSLPNYFLQCWLNLSGLSCLTIIARVSFPCIWIMASIICFNCASIITMTELCSSAVLRPRNRNVSRKLATTPRWALGKGNKRHKPLSEKRRKYLYGLRTLLFKRPTLNTEHRNTKRMNFKFCCPNDHISAILTSIIGYDRKWFWLLNSI